MSELRKVRNIRPGFYKGLWRGLITAAIETVTAGKLPRTLALHADHEAYDKLEASKPPDRHWVERDLPPRDRLAAVYFAATEHDEDQPVHLHILEPDVCAERCTSEYGNPCTKFCPAAVYEMVEDEAGRRLQINAANCVHCKTCDIKDPYQIIDWVTPEGGAGPNYQNL
jgi:electron-transferring-flavoprotein dehydrogenase